jgi:hypothetical protein
MKSIFRAIIASTILILPAFAQNQGGNNQGGNNNQGGHHGAPGPVAGAGFPLLAVGLASTG